MPLDSGGLGDNSSCFGTHSHGAGCFGSTADRHGVGVNFLWRFGDLDCGRRAAIRGGCDRWFGLVTFDAIHDAADRKKGHYNEA